MIIGKAVSGAICSNLIIVGVLRALIIAGISDLYEKSTSGEISIEELENTDAVQKFVTMGTNSGTSVLWLQYIEMINILCGIYKR